MLLLTEVGCLWYHWIENEEIADLKDHKETDEKGTVSFDLAAGGKHAITLSGTPTGYAVEKSYSFNGNTADIVVTSSLVTGENLGEHLWHYRLSHLCG